MDSEDKSVVAPVIDNQHWLIKDAKRWYKDSARLVSKCSKPDYEGEWYTSTKVLVRLYVEAHGDAPSERCYHFFKRAHMIVSVLIVHGCSSHFQLL